MNIKEIAILSIDCSRYKMQAPESLIEKLAKSIENTGLINPIIVESKKKITRTFKYTLIDGLLRIEAFKKLGRRTIAAIIKD